MRDDDPVLRLLRRTLYGFAVAITIIAAGALLLSLSSVAEPEGTAGTTDPTTVAAARVLGWTALAAGPAVGLRIGGLSWRRAAWVLPAVPLLVVLVAVLG